MRILVTDSKGKQEAFEINENEYIKDVKEKIKTKLGINLDIVLHCNGEILEEINKISDYDIENNSVIVYMGKFRGGFLL